MIDKALQKARQILAGGKHDNGSQQRADRLAEYERMADTSALDLYAEEMAEHRRRLFNSMWVPNEVFDLRKGVSHTAFDLSRYARKLFTGAMAKQFTSVQPISFDFDALTKTRNKPRFYGAVK